MCNKNSLLTANEKILDCLRGLEYAVKLGWFNLKTFNLRDYEYYEKIENGDMNWVIPGKFLAFSGPSPSSHDPEGVILFHIGVYCLWL